jgi:prepilin-type N-terminal cleavage/methylation domain-containing protein
MKSAISNLKFQILRRRGLSLAECLISLAITASLLTAAAAAFHASTQAIEDNDQFYRASQAARVSLNQIMTQVRRCQSGVVDTNSLEVMTDTGEKRTYALDGTNLTMTFTPAGTLVPAKMASNVQSLTFGTDGKSVTMTITIAVGKNTVTMCGSAFPRRLVTYN